MWAGSVFVHPRVFDDTDTYLATSPARTPDSVLLGSSFFSSMSTDFTYLTTICKRGTRPSVLLAPAIPTFRMWKSCPSLAAHEPLCRDPKKSLFLSPAQDQEMPLLVIHQGCPHYEGQVSPSQRHFRCHPNSLWVPSSRQTDEERSAWRTSPVEDCKVVCRAFALIRRPYEGQGQLTEC